MDNENKNIDMEETPIGIKPLEGGNESVTTIPSTSEVISNEVASQSVPASVVEEPTNEIQLVRTQSIPVQTEAPVKEEIVQEPVPQVGIVNNPEPKRNEKKKTSIADIIMYIIMVVIIIVIILLLLKFCEDGRNDGKGIVTTTTKVAESTTTTTKTIVTNPTTQLVTDPITTQTTTGTTTKKVNTSGKTTTRPSTTKKKTTKKSTTKPSTTSSTTTTTTTTTTTKKVNEYSYTYVVQTSETFAVTFYNNGKKITEDITVLVDGFPVASGRNLITIDIDDINVGKEPKITFIYDSNPNKTCTAVHE